MNSEIDYGIPNKEKGVDLLDQPHSEKSKSDKPMKSFILNFVDNKYSEFTHRSGFTFTINRNRTQSHHLSYMRDDKDVHRFVDHKLHKSKHWRKRKWIMFPEFGNNGKLHYHGIIFDEYQATVMVMIKWWRVNFGFAKPELVIKDHNNWNKYITKDYGKTGLWTLHNYQDQNIL